MYNSLIGKYLYKMLTKIGYSIPTDVRKPKTKVLLLFICSFLLSIAFAITSIYDDWVNESISIVGLILRFLSTFSICVNITYKKARRKAEFNHIVNRLKLKKSTFIDVPILQEAVYDKLRHWETIAIEIFIIGTVFCIFVPCFDTPPTILTQCCGIIYKIVCGFHAVVNLGISIIEILVEFYKAEDIKYIRQKRSDFI